MQPEEIKQECEAQYKQIKDAESRLKELRSICKHENTYEGNYSWRVGCINPASICSDCGSLIKINLFDFGKPLEPELAKHLNTALKKAASDKPTKL